jgi:DNA (cytosine-5)-methyltransferase 1
VKDVLDLQDYGQSIFTRKKPLVEPSLKRIYEGLVKFCGADFLYKYYSTGSNLQSMNDPAATLGTKDTFAAVFIANYYTGEQQITSAEAPCPTITTVPHQALVTAQYVMDPQFNNVGTSIENPAPTILASRHHHKLVSAQFLLNPKYSSKGSSINDPCFTLIARMDKAPPQLISTSLGHVEILSTDSPMTIKIKEFMRDHGISDIFVRMLKIPELKRIMGFPNSYVLTGTQTQQKKHIGNAVERRQATALAQANVEANALRD